MFAAMKPSASRQLFMHELTVLYGEDECKAMLRILLEHMGVNMRNNEALSQEQQQQLHDAIERLKQFEPLQYITGEAWFYNRRFMVDSRVLIPRPETEELVHWVLNSLPGNKHMRVIDIGTGSGCIAITLKAERPAWQVCAMDKSADALALAATNASALKQNIMFKLTDFTHASEWPVEQFSVIVSNPPYIPMQERDMLDKNVAEHEPADALFVPSDDPFLFYRLLAQFAASNLEERGFLFAECHQQYAAEVYDLFRYAGFETVLRNDINNNPRMLRAQRKAE